jgi:hypothetical protein
MVEVASRKDLQRMKVSIPSTTRTSVATAITTVKVNIRSSAHFAIHRRQIGGRGHAGRSESASGTDAT